jgi:hypothetical protein
MRIDGNARSGPAGTVEEALDAGEPGRMAIRSKR